MNPYEVLGVPRDATPEEIKKAFRQKANENHSDKGGDDETMREVNIAYAVLRDPAKRRRYDETGEASASELSEPERTVQIILESVLGRHDPRRDPFAEARKEIEKNLHQFSQEIPEQEERIRGWSAIKARVKMADGARDLATPILETKIARAEARLVALRDGIQMARVMLGILEAYQYDLPVATVRGLSVPSDWVLSPSDVVAGIVGQYGQTD